MKDMVHVYISGWIRTNPGCSAQIWSVYGHILAVLGQFLAFLVQFQTVLRHIQAFHDKIYNVL